MNLKITFILFSLLGVSASFMPWVYYPRAKGYIYGYESDGFITGFLFLLILIAGIYIFNKKKTRIIWPAILGLLGILMGYTAYDKYTALELEKINFSTDDPIIAYSTAGFTQGIGIYVLGIAGVGVFISILIRQLLESKSLDTFSKNSNDGGIFSPLVKGVIATVLLFVLFGVFYFMLAHKKPNESQIKEEISASISSMGNALIQEQYDEFINFNHPLMVQSNGGRQKTIQLLKAALDEIKINKKRIKTIELSAVYDIKIQDNSIQALIGQSITIDSSGIDRIELQKMLAISENNGSKWHFININGKTKAEMTQFFPNLNQELNF